MLYSSAKEEWIAEKEPTGFFPGASVAQKPEPTPSYPLDPPLRPDGFIPNSILIRLLWPREITDDMANREYQPPKLTDAQLCQLKGRKVGTTTLYLCLFHRTCT